MVEFPHTLLKKQFQIIFQINRRACFQNAGVFYRQHICQQTVGIPIGTKLAPLLADLILHSIKADFIAYLIQKKEHRLF